MDDGLKQRIIGAFVLLAIAVIFVPVLFDKERIEPLDRTTQLPPAPHIEPIIIQEPEPTKAPEEAKPAEKMFLPDDSEPVDDRNDIPRLNEKGVPNAWVLQVASFRFEGHAKQFKEKLNADGYKAYTQVVQTKHGKMVRVFVGPKMNKSSLLKDKEAIEKKHKTSSMILKYEP
ncbi:SPOR domain-containing protein [Teredinibacter sp. KSP-S5-2]|uniref:SPOR domain-containing protein n=1 Tax=Teredinibacter sp. KSP-S5-2 TaxID=3034506 RepID=UPI00293510BE|nr:SPOR domain-containing protein [Teredinibacter sp. KSP-S5-2]WNO10986.1 SPOR domain-containing protein [Teredinibacter sp. KSP-S5-2]